MLIILSLILGFIFGVKATQFIYRKNIKSAPLPLLKTPQAPIQDASILEYKIWYEEEANFLFGLAEKLSLDLDPKSVAKSITEAACNFLGAQKAACLMFNRDTAKLNIEYAIGVEEGIIQSLALDKKESISGFVMDASNPLIVTDLDSEGYLKTINKENYLGRAFISVPLIFQNERLGVLHASGKKSGLSFDQRDLRFMINVGRIGAIAFHNARLKEQIQDDYLRTITALATALDAKDSYTKWHSDNVARYSVAIAKEMGLRSYEIEMIRRAALLHDIGKIGIQDSILMKNTKVTEEEFEKIKLHPVKSEEIVKSLSFLKEISLLIRHHHEKYDGTGYPDGLKGYKIELGARILAVADAFDAMTSDRLYKKAMAHEEAVQELNRHTDTQFDPEVVGVFIKIVEQNPSILKPTT